MWLAEKVLGRIREAPVPATMSRLQSRKAEVQQQYEARRASARFEPTDPPDAEEGPSPLNELQQPHRSATRPEPRPNLTPDEPEEQSYTSRLLKAKKDVWKDRDRDS